MVLVGCSEDSATVGTSEDANLTEAGLAELVEQDPTLAAIKAIVLEDVEGYEIVLGDDIGVPEPSASTGVTLASGYGVRGLDWFKTPNASYPNNKSWDQGSDTGKRCQWAAVFRFEQIFATPPAEAETMKAESVWSGRMWGWMDDYAATDRVGHPRQPYAWSDSLWKWINASGADGICRTPTRSMVVGMMEACLQKANDNDGRPKGCRMPTRATSCSAIDAEAAACDGVTCSLDTFREQALESCCDEGLATTGCAYLERQPPDQNSCVDVCGEIGRAPGGCWCDRTCAEADDPAAAGCCADYSAVCQ